MCNNKKSPRFHSATIVRIKETKAEDFRGTIPIGGRLCCTPTFSIGRIQTANTNPCNGRIPSRPTADKLLFGGLLRSQLSKPQYRLAPTGSSLKTGRGDVISITAFIIVVVIIAEKSGFVKHIFTIFQRACCLGHWAAIRRWQPTAGGIMK